MKLFSNKRVQELVKLFFYIILYCIILNILNISCPIKFLTGVSCAGCGMTRAFMSLLQGHIKEAFTYHPLFFTVPIFVVVYLIKDKIPKKIFNLIVAIYIVAFITCYIIRLLNPNDMVVVFKPSQSIFYRLIKGGI